MQMSQQRFKRWLLCSSWLLMRNNHPEEINAECLLLNNSLVGSSPISLVRNILQNWVPKVFFRKGNLICEASDWGMHNKAHLWINTFCAVYVLWHTLHVLLRVSYRRFLCQSWPMNCTLGMQEGIPTTFCKSLKESTHSTSAHAQQMQTKKAQIQLLG